MSLMPSTSRKAECFHYSRYYGTVKLSKRQRSDARAWLAQWPDWGFTGHSCVSLCSFPMLGSKIPAPQFRRVVAKSDAVRNMCIQYNEVLLSQARITAACNALHVVEARFCRWLLQSADRAESDTVALTQEFLAEMLGVRRTSVTEVAGKIQTAGAINYSRGQITIVNRRRFGENVLRVLSDARGSVGHPDLAARIRQTPRDLADLASGTGQTGTEARIYDYLMSNSSDGVTAMVKRRRRIVHKESFEERLAEEARRFKEAAEEQPHGSMARELLLRRARQAETASRMNDWLSSPGLASPK